MEHHCVPRPGLSTEDSAGNQACPQEAYILVMEKIQQVVTIQCKEIVTAGQYRGLWEDK